MKQLMNKLPVLLVFIVFILESCTSIKVEKLNNAGQIEDYGIIYNLPATELLFNISIEKTTEIKGPYAEFSEKYLGIKDVIIVNKTKYALKDYSYNTITIPDSSQYYIITSQRTPLPSISLSANGMLTGVNTSESTLYKNEAYSIHNKNFTKQEFPAFRDLSIKNNFKEVKKTTYKEIKTDSTIKKVPVYHSSSARKTKEEKAEEAANFIIKLRKRKFKLMAGMSDTEPPSNGIQNMINELEKLEEQYLQLFIGKKLSEQQTFTCAVVPKKGKQKQILGYFSEANGFTIEKKQQSEELSVLFQPSKNYLPIDTLYGRQKELDEKTKGIVYRIPDYTNFALQLGSLTVFETSAPINQLGTTNTLPSSILKEKREVSFNPETGELLQIQ